MDSANQSAQRHPPIKPSCILIKISGDLTWSKRRIQRTGCRHSNGFCLIRNLAFLINLSKVNKDNNWENYFTIIRRRYNLFDDTITILNLSLIWSFMIAAANIAHKRRDKCEEADILNGFTLSMNNTNLKW